MAKTKNAPIERHTSPPSWVEKEAQEITGLDLLGLRAPVNAIGNALLDGVTLTCWRARARGTP